MSEQAMRDPTERTLYEEPHDDHWGTFKDRLYVCGPLPRQGIGISVAGTTYVRPLKDWHKLESERDALKAELKKADEVWVKNMEALKIELLQDRDLWKQRAEEAETVRAALHAKAERLAEAIRGMRKMMYGLCLDLRQAQVAQKAIDIAKQALAEVEGK